MDEFIKELNMLPHNYEAYQKVMAHYDSGRNKAAVVHATGTGKSYIIAAVAHHFNNVLIIAPNTFVLNETRKVCKGNVAFRTYTSIMLDFSPRNDYDLIVLDEFHRAGAEKWGLGVQNIITMNTGAKLLGTSATAIRYLDKERNMADEVFDGEVVSSIPLKEALDRKLLPMPVYVSALYSIDVDANKRIKRLSKAKYQNIPKCNEYIRKLQGLAHNWDNAHGVPAIMRKYLNKDTRRMIVFCAYVSRAEKSRIMLGSWFASAGFTRIRFYNIDYKNKLVEQEMEDYERDNYDGLKVAISVNMLNEGIHIPRVDAIIMLRSTYSRIIIEQQVGRCLTSNNKGIRPVVFDLVNNMDSIGYRIIGWADECNTIERAEEEGGEGFFPFTITDENRDIRMFLTQIDNVLERDSIWYDKYLPINQKFYDETGHLPTKKEHASCYVFNVSQRDKNLQEKYPHRAEWLKAHGFSLERRDLNSVEQRMDIVEEALKKAGNSSLLMQQNRYAYEAYAIFKYEYLETSTHYRRSRKPLMNAEMRKRFGKLYEEYSSDWFPHMRRIKKVVLKKGYKNLSRNERRWLLKQVKTITDPDKIALMDSFDAKSFVVTIAKSHDEELIAYLRKYNKVPGYRENKALYATAMRFKIEIYQKRKPELFNLLLKCGFSVEKTRHQSREGFEERCKRIMKECTKRGIYVIELSGADYCFYKKAVTKHRDNPLVIEMENKVIQFRNDDKFYRHDNEYSNNMLADVRRIGALGYIIPSDSKYGRWYRGQVNKQISRGIPKPDWYEELKTIAHIFANNNNRYNKNLKRWNDNMTLDNEPQ